MPKFFSHARRHQYFLFCIALVHLAHGLKHILSERNAGDRTMPACSIISITPLVCFLSACYCCITRNLARSNYPAGSCCCRHYSFQHQPVYHQPDEMRGLGMAPFGGMLIWLRGLY